MPSDASAVGRALGMVTVFMKKVEDAIRAEGGDEEDIARLSKADSNEAIKLFAREFLCPTPPKCNSIEEQIAAGCYDQIFKYAGHPALIQGQEFHESVRPLDLHISPVVSNPWMIEEQVRVSFATLSEFLDYGLRNPKSHLEWPLVILWRDRHQGLWYARIQSQKPHRRTRQLRTIEIDCVARPTWVRFPQHTRYLVVE